MYSFYPTPDITASPVGFSIVTFIIMLVAVVLVSDVETKLGKFFLVVVAVFMIYITRNVCYFEKQYTNEKIVAEFVGFASEVKTERCGKQNCEKQYSHVIYKVKDGNIMFPSSLGIVYPQRAILYKN